MNQFGTTYTHYIKINKVSMCGLGALFYWTAGRVSDLSQTTDVCLPITQEP